MKGWTTIRVIGSGVSWSWGARCCCTSRLKRGVARGEASVHEIDSDQMAGT